MDPVRNHFLLQANLNHCAGAQDLVLQTMAERSIGVAVVTEPYFIPVRPDWVGDMDGSVAIISSSAPLSIRERSRGFVAATWGDIILFGVYFSPNKSLAEFEDFLDRLGTSVRRMMPSHAIVMGDFNAKSIAWGSPGTDVRGVAVEEWVTAAGLCLLNRGSVNTCVRQQGGSIVDLSFATPALAARVQRWRVLESVETLSDHLYICMDVSTSSGPTVSPRPDARQFPRWALMRLDGDLLEEAAIVQAWLSSQPAAEGVDVEADCFRGAMTAVCDAAMPRSRRQPPKRAVYWWSQEIADLRAACIIARRTYSQVRRLRRRDEELETLQSQLHEAYRNARASLQLAICRGKEQSRAEALEDLNRDPWGRPYRAARKKLRAQGPPLTETLQPQFLVRVVETLFPDPVDHPSPTMTEAESEQDAEVETPRISDVEMGAAILRARSKRTAPGPDGVPARALALALEAALEDRLRELFDACLTSRRFPKAWKEGRLVLLQKAGRPLESPSAYRPIVLLDEAGKMLEKILAARIVRHLEAVGPNLSDAQFGFRAGRSTVDAILRLKADAMDAVAQGGVLLAVSLDIANAFNTLPFSCIEEALRYHQVPVYLRQLVADYLQGRFVCYEGCDGRVVRRAITCGVPQGSVLGPLVWNIGYDWALRCLLSPGQGVICYADDTLVTARGGSYEEAAHSAIEATSLVVGRIEALGLKVALEKTEALVFHAPRRRPPAGAHLTIGGATIAVRASMKYLGLVLDRRWNFGEHFAQLAPKLIGTASALSRLLPNLGGPNVVCRRLYTGVVRSMALYGAPVWAESLSAQNKALLRRPQRVMAVRVIRGYRTISAEAACALAGTPPWDLEAQVLAEVYWRGADLQVESGRRPPPELVTRWRREAQAQTLRIWRVRLETPSAGHWTVGALQPILDEWVRRRHGTMSFRLVQVLSGHGCFGKYLHKVARREVTPVCHQCGCSEDTALHTLEHCPAWVVQRRALAAAIGADLSLPAVTKAMVDSRGAWEAVASFCEDVISQKEAAERLREEDSLADAIRRKRTGRRRRRHGDLMPP